jgi:chromosome segregation ATPase
LYQRFFRSSKLALPHWLRECIQVSDQEEGSEQEENVVAFPRGRIGQTRNEGQSALDLVYQAAEVVGSLQDEARQIEARAQSLCRDAIEKLRSAERRTEASQNALNIAESRIASAEARLSAAELRASKAENRARELDQALTQIEQAIKTRLLGAGRSEHVFPGDGPALGLRLKGLNRHVC